jgi:LPXTG-motif cell wall-anchored protein
MSNETENEKDNFWFYIAGVIVLAIGLVFLLKSRETESVPYSAYAETDAQVTKQMKNAK